MLDLKHATDDQRRLKSNVLHEENMADQQNLDHYTRKHSCQQPPIADDQHRLISNVLPKESTIGQQNLARYSRKRVLKEANYTSTASDTITLMNYTISSHSKINSKINFALKIIFKLNFRVS